MSEPILLQDVAKRAEIGLPEIASPEVAVVTSFTDYRAWCGSCHWSGAAWAMRREANADMREHNKKYHHA